MPPRSPPPSMCRSTSTPSGCFAGASSGVADTVRQIADTGAAGCSIEDYDPPAGRIDDITVATERVAAARPPV